MKRCPRCGQIYTDDLVYCLQDGTALLPDHQEAEEVTVVRPPAQPETRSTGILKYAALGLAALVIIGLVGAAGAYLVLSRFGDSSRQQTVTENVSAGPTATPTVTPSIKSTPKQTPDPSVSEKQVALERERERLAEERRKLDEKKRSDDDEDDSGAVDAATSRIAFRKGAASETVAGRITNARSFVLRTLAGQFLSASVRSEGDCVVFADGSPNAGFVTRQGDSRLDLRNNCDGTRRFRLSVSVR